MVTLVPESSLSANQPPIGRKLAANSGPKKAMYLILTSGNSVVDKRDMEAA